MTVFLHRMFFLLGGHRFGEIARAIDVAATHDGNVIGQQLHRNNGKNSLQIDNNSVIANQV